MNRPKARKYGQNGILLEWEPKISPQIHDHVVRTSTYLKEKYAEVILELVPSYHSLLIFLKNDVDVHEHIDIFRYVDMSKFEYLSFEINRTWEIPVCYDLSFGYDLITLAQTAQMDTESIVELHSETAYRIYGMGFLPGFLYLGGLDERLHLPRKTKVNQFVPKGSVAIGGKQTGIYPQSSPGGWNVIGRTPIELFDATSVNPTPFSVGDSIQFVPIDLNEFDDIRSAVKAGNYSLNFEAND